MDCQSFDRLRDWVEDRLPSAAAVGVHVLECAVCQSALDRLTDDDDLRRRLDARQRIRTAKTDCDAVGRIIDQLAATPPDDLLDGRQGVELAGGANGGPGPNGALGSVGTFQLLNELGRGGMGIVYRAWDESLCRVVALKVLRPEHREEVDRLRLVREAQLAARFRDDHAVNVYSVVMPAEGLPYLVMEYVEGPTLAELIASGNRPASRRAAGFIAEVADAVQAAHAAGLIHRDVKPSNILIDARTDRAKITDFGLARAITVTSSLSRDGYLAGTPNYMSPEQARGEPDLDGRTDVYGLGATLYEALTGATPYRGAPIWCYVRSSKEIPGRPRS